MQRFKKIFIIWLVSWALMACSHSGTKRNLYVVRPGDTLYSIAKKNKLKLTQLAKINQINAPKNLKAGQKLILFERKFNPNKPLESRSSRTISFKDRYKAQLDSKNNYYKQNSYKDHNNHNNKDHKQKFSPALKNPTVANMASSTKQALSLSKVTWGWPAQGKIIKTFNRTGLAKGNGIELVGKKGDPILAAATGKVVYSGNGLRGYGNLVIIKHDQDFLSAYAHNQKLLVAEQQTVTKGQQIATMGDTEAKQVVLHFEIRYKGKPIDPLLVLRE